MNRIIKFSKNDLHIKCHSNSDMEEQLNEKDITKETLKPITKVKSKVDKECRKSKKSNQLVEEWELVADK